MASTRIFAIPIMALFLSLPNTSFGQGRPAVVSAVATDRAVGQPQESADQNRPVAAERNPRYKINRDDVLALSFPLSPEFNQPKVMVQPDGYVTLQGAGSLYVQGMTVPDAVEAVKKAYSRTLHEAIVDIDLVDFQKAYFVVLGQVTKPGQYDLRYDMTVTQAVAIAGGFAPTAKMQVFLYHRGAGGWVEAKELKLNDILHGKSVTEDVSMRPGDMIFVPEKTITKIRKYIPYGFATTVNPGYY